MPKHVRLIQDHEGLIRLPPATAQDHMLALRHEQALALMRRMTATTTDQDSKAAYESAVSSLVGVGTETVYSREAGAESGPKTLHAAASEKTGPSESSVKSQSPPMVCAGTPTEDRACYRTSTASQPETSRRTCAHPVLMQNLADLSLGAPSQFVLDMRRHMAQQEQALADQNATMTKTWMETLQHWERRGTIWAA